MTLEAGQPLGHMVLRHKIAEGGMGVVWAAEHLGLGRDVAIKFLSTHIVENPEAVARFTLEARTLARITSPHTPQVFDHGVCEDGTPYIAMELVAGTDLGDWVGGGGVMSPSAVARLLDQMALALAAAHDLGIVHRDIKPENIILTGGRDDFHAKLIDFGIAKSVLSEQSSKITMIGETVGTPSYMSPEQIAGASDVDERADMWSLAVVAYYCLTQKLPFGGDVSGAVYVAIHQGQVTAASELRPDLPASLDEWFDRALARDIDQRFDSVEAMRTHFHVAAERLSSPAAEPIPLVRRSTPVKAIDLLEAPAIGKRGRRRTSLRVACAAALGVFVTVAPSALGTALGPALRMMSSQISPALHGAH
jgi:eukaryotic-like serine/threonine-protein kinase